MSETTLRWGLGLGALAAGTGLATQLVGGWFRPPTTPTTIDREVQYVIVAGMLTLAALGLALGLAYYAGLRSERDRLAGGSASVGDMRRESGWAGTIVMAAYWLVTTLAILLAPHHTGDPSVGMLATQRLVLGLIFLAFGYGLGMLGSRAPAARSLLDDISSRPRAGAVPIEEMSPAPGEPSTSHEANP
jgi:hypothetical protein